MNSVLYRPVNHSATFVPFAGLPLFWSSASKRGFQLSDVVRLLSRRTAQLCRLDDQKGSLAPGYDADLVVWDPDREFQVSNQLNTFYDKENSFIFIIFILISIFLHRLRKQAFIIKTRWTTLNVQMLCSHSSVFLYDWVGDCVCVCVCSQLTPYLGVTLQGVVCATIIRGRLVYREGSFCPEPLGKHLLLPQRKTQAQLWNTITTTSRSKTSTRLTYCVVWICREECTMLVLSHCLSSYFNI